LLDEPMSALDAHTRASVRAELNELLRDLGLPAMLVTHDFEDAAALADRVGVIVDGKILQLGSSAELVEAPANPFVASFTGGNLVPGLARPGPDGLTSVELDAGGTVLSTDGATGRVGVVIYPWEVAVASRPIHGDSALNHLDGAVTSIVPLGNRVRLRVGPIVAEITAASAERLGLGRGDEVFISFKASATRLVPIGGASRHGGDRIE
jgi:ABC-type Fe3+/spermidine/putrescine transport system ATPase subunit